MGVSEIRVPYWGPHYKGILLFGGVYVKAPFGGVLVKTCRVGVYTPCDRGTRLTVLLKVPREHVDVVPAFFPQTPLNKCVPGRCGWAWGLGFCELTFCVEPTLSSDQTDTYSGAKPDAFWMALLGFRVWGFTRSRLGGVQAHSMRQSSASLRFRTLHGLLLEALPVGRLSATASTGETERFAGT